MPKCADEPLGEHIVLGGELIPAPEGIKGEVSITSMCVNGAWAIWYQSALDALNARLTPEQIQASDLPQVTKVHLGLNESQAVIDRVLEVVEAHKI